MTGSAADDSDTYRFHHILIRDTAYNALLKRARATLHERFVAWAEQVNRERDREQEFEEILGYHLEQAFRYRAELGPIDAEGRQIGTRAAQRLGAAGRRAFARGDLPAATNLLERAAALREDGDPERIELQVDLGEAQLERGSLSRGHRDARRGYDRSGRDRGCTTGSPRLPQQEVHRDLCRRRGREPPRARSSCVCDSDLRSGRRSRRTGTRVAVADVVHGTAGRYDEAAAAAERVVEYGVAAGDARMATRGAQIYASAALVGTLPASEVRERCERLRAQVAGDRKAEAVILAVLAQVYAMQGDFARAREESERQRQMLAELGPSLNAISTSIERARVESLAGDLPAAELELRADDAALAEIDERYFRSTVVGMLAGVLVELGRFEDAAAAVETARDLADEDDALSQILWRTAHARLLAEADNPDEAVAQAESAVALAADGDDIDLLGDVKSALGEVLLRAGRRDMAEPPLREALALYERKEDVASASRVRLRLETLASGADPTSAS